MAEQLLALYAERKAGPATRFRRTRIGQREFDDAFEFEETPDQQRAIEDVKRDMESTLPMDRLLCGDVGYGKTEVAMRAAFKAIARFEAGGRAGADYGAGVPALSNVPAAFRRVSGARRNDQPVSHGERTEKSAGRTGSRQGGRADRHAPHCFPKDVKFQDLGLLVVDEEQRFGVAHKERLKEMRKNVDVLTMSATPIPRTLHMSLVGLRDMSVIETPPKDRLAIQTTVAPFSETLVQRVIEEELARDGQVFFVHNRVESIDLAGGHDQAAGSRRRAWWWGTARCARPNWKK